MGILTFDIICIAITIGLLFSFIMKNLKKTSIVTILILLVVLPIFFGYFYTFGGFIFNQILVFFLVVLFSTTIGIFITKVDVLLTKALITLVFIILAISIISKGKIKYYTLYIEGKIYVDKNYYYEVTTIVNNNGRFSEFTARTYKYYLWNFIKKRVNTETLLFDDDGNIYEMMDDGNIIVSAPSTNYKIINKLPLKKIYDYPSKKFFKNQKNKKLEKIFSGTSSNE